MKIYQKLRVFFYKLLSIKISHVGKSYQPILAEGRGTIHIGKSSIGNKKSPFYFSGYTYLEARSPHSTIEIGDHTQINNNAVIIAEKTSIKIGNHVLIGTEFCVYDSDFHELNPNKRLSNEHQCMPVIIKDNVFIGSRVTILKGVTIHENSVIGSGSVVTKNIPANEIWAGVPAKKVGDLNSATKLTP